MTEAEIQRAILLGCSDLAVLWRNHTGRIRDSAGRYHTFGLAVGSSDIVGIRKSDGRFVAIEVKSLDGRLSPEQRLYLGLVARCGGLSGVARSVEQARAVIEGTESYDG